MSPRLRADYPLTATRRAIEAVGGVAKAAEICGVTTKAVQSWLRRGSVPGLREAVTLADATGVDLRELAGPHKER